VNKWSGLWVIIDFIFEQQQPKQMPFDAAKQSVLRVCAARVSWSGIESKKAC